MNRDELFPLLARVALLLVIILGWGVFPLPARVTQSMQRSIWAVRSGDQASAGDLIAEAASHLPGRGDLWAQAGRLAFEAQDFQGAIERLRQADSIQSLTPAERLMLGDALYKEGDIHGAIAAWEAVIQVTASPEAYERLAQAHDRLGEPQKAIADFLALVKLQPKDSQLLFSFGKYLAVYHPEEALAYLSEAALLDTALSTPYHTLQAGINEAFLQEDPAYRAVVIGRALAAIDDWPSAEKAFEMATQRDPTYAEAWALLGEARQQLGSTGKMEIEQAVNLNSSSTLVEALTARYWVRQARLDLAIHFLQKAVDQEPANPVWQAEMGELQAQNGDLEKASGYYQRAAQMTPQDPTYWRLLAGFSLRYSMQVHEVGLPAARQVLALAPNAANSSDLMGQVMVALNDYASAERFYQKAFSVDPQYAVAQLHLGQLDILRGDLEASYIHLHLVLNLQPDGETADQARELLDQYFPN